MNILKRMESYSKLGSWAIWESNNANKTLEKESDLNENIKFEDYIDQLQPSNYVILAMNPGGKFDKENAKLSTRKEVSSGRKWSNFHNIGRSRDYLFASAIMDTKLYGSYMTDLFPIAGSDSEEIKDFIQDLDNTELVKRLILEFDEEMECLLPKETEIILICVGKKVSDWVKKYLIDNTNLKKKYKSYYFPHYSGANRNVSSKKGTEKYYPNVFKNKVKEYDLDL